MWKKEVNSILDAILNSETFKDSRSETSIKEDIEYYGIQRRRTDVEIELLYGFFEEDMEKILEVNEIWLWLKREIREMIELTTTDTKTFLKDGLYFKMEDYVNQQLENLLDSLSKFYEERLDSEWQGLTVLKAEGELPKNQIYIALLDKDEKLTCEPYPITRNTEAEVTWTIKEKKVTYRWSGTKVHRYIQVTTQPPHEKHYLKEIRLNPDVVKAKVIKT